MRKLINLDPLKVQGVNYINFFYDRVIESVIIQPNFIGSIISPSPHVIQRYSQSQRPGPVRPVGG
jgi:hypothetical protein